MDLQIPLFLNLILNKLLSNTFVYGSDAKVGNNVKFTAIQQAVAELSLGDQDEVDSSDEEGLIVSQNNRNIIVEAQPLYCSVIGENETMKNA